MGSWLAGATCASDVEAESLRISASLDLDAVLQEATDSGHALTGARYGAIATTDESGIAPTRGCS